jgi:glycosyltransferase involved in cell wall biosynthesis
MEYSVLPRMHESKENSICMIATSYPTWEEGAGRLMAGKFVHDMAKYFAKDGFDVHVVTQHGRHTPRQEKRDGVTIHRFHYFYPPWESLTREPGIPHNIRQTKNKLLVPFYFFFLMVRAFRVIRNHQLRVINAHWGFPNGYVGLILKGLTRSGLIITLYGAELFPFVKRRGSVITRLLIRAIRGADAVAGISSETVRAAQAVSGRDDIAVIPDGIDMSYYVPGDKNDAILAKYHCSGKRIIFYTGRMVERKGHAFAVKAMAYIHARHINAKLLLGGNGPLFPALTRLRSELHLEDVVEMPGVIPEEDLVPLLQSADIHVLPSCVDINGDTEGSATAALEAMACGTPSIVSRVGGNIGAIEPGKGAYYFESGDPKDLADKILTLLTDSALWKQNKRESRLFVESRYAWNISIDKYRQLMRDKHL